MKRKERKLKEVMSERAKRCTECGKIVRINNESLLCSYHAMLRKQQENNGYKKHLMVEDDVIAKKGFMEDDEEIMTKEEAEELKEKLRYYGYL